MLPTTNDNDLGDYLLINLNKFADVILAEDPLFDDGGFGEFQTALPASLLPFHLPLSIPSRNSALTSQKKSSRQASSFLLFCTKTPSTRT